MVLWRHCQVFFTVVYVLQRPSLNFMSVWQFGPSLVFAGWVELVDPKLVWMFQVHNHSQVITIKRAGIFGKIWEKLKGYFYLRVVLSLSSINSDFKVYFSFLNLLIMDFCDLTGIDCNSFNLFVPNTPFLFPPENIRKPDDSFLVFSRVEKGCIGNEWIKNILWVILVTITHNYQNHSYKHNWRKRISVHMQLSFLRGLPTTDLSTLNVNWSY